MKKSSKDLGISRKISLIRSHFSLTADRLGELAGVSGTAIANIEAGKSLNPGAEMLASISTMLGVNLNWLLLGEGEMLKSSSIPSTNKKTEPAGRTKDEFAKEYPFVVSAPSAPFNPKPRAGRSELPTTPLPGTDLVEQVARNTADIQKLFALVESMSDVKAL